MMADDTNQTEAPAEAPVEAAARVLPAVSSITCA